jgi:hypothetical protein
MWISELDSAQLGTVKIGSFHSKDEAIEATNKWLNETKISDGEEEVTMGEWINDSWTDEIFIFEENDYEWEYEDEDGEEDD